MKSEKCELKLWRASTFYFIWKILKNDICIIILMGNSCTVSLPEHSCRSPGEGSRLYSQDMCSYPLTQSATNRLSCGSIWMHMKWYKKEVSHQTIVCPRKHEVIQWSISEEIHKHTTIHLHGGTLYGGWKRTRRCFMHRFGKSSKQSH